MSIVVGIFCQLLATAVLSGSIAVLVRFEGGIPFVHGLPLEENSASESLAGLIYAFPEVIIYLFTLL